MDAVSGMRGTLWNRVPLIFSTKIFYIHFLYETIAMDKNNMFISSLICKHQSELPGGLACSWMIEAV